MERSEGNTSDEENAGTGNSAGQEAGVPADSASDVSFRGFWLGLASLVGLGLLIGFIRWATLPSDDRYIWPVSQADWTAWGTWAGALGAIAAVVFASLSIKQAIAAQKGAERKWEADRTHDRTERELERQLVREEREELKQELDQIALYEAGQLTFGYSWNRPLDNEYQAVQDRLESYEADRSARREQGDWSVEDEGVWPSDREHDHAFIVIRNGSEDIAFDELCLLLADEDEENELEVTQVRLFERDVPLRRRGEQWLPGEPPAWIPRTDYEPDLPFKMKQWTLGSIKPKGEFMVELTFTTPQYDLDWTGHNPWDPNVPKKNVRRVILGYRDQKKRHWIRSTRSDRNVPRRLLDVGNVPPS